MKIRKATDIEQRQYVGLYPLFGFVKVPGTLGGVRAFWNCAVEYLGEGRGEPNYEAIAPKGMHFYDGDRLHTLLGFTQRDLIDRLHSLEECDEDCDDGVKKTKQILSTLEGGK